MSRLSSKKKPVILITMGDPAGIGPEIIAKNLHRLKKKHSLIIFGDLTVLKKAGRLSGFSCEKFSSGFLRRQDIILRGSRLPRSFRIKDAGRIDPVWGQFSIKWIEEAVACSRQMQQENQPHALVTAPINKASAHSGGFQYTGHTDFLAHLYGARETSMMFVSRRLNLILVNIHCSLQKAIRNLNKSIILQKIRHAHTAMEKWGSNCPEILVSGLNPHAGETGAFGKEEEIIIAPAIKEAKDQGIMASGPYPPDTVFLKALDNKNTCVVAMHHDQGLIPFKLLDFSHGVNVTVGLPVVRTSPDHGTAYDIAWKGKADPTSFYEAAKLAMKSIKP